MRAIFRPMIPKQKHPRHTCTLHPHKTAIGVCAHCGKHLCRVCAVIVESSMYCVHPVCLPAKIRAVATDQLTNATIEPEKQPQQQLDHSWKRIVFWSALTTALCGVVLATWALREMMQIKNDNTLLEGNRLVLIEQLRLNKREILTLKEAASATTPPHQPIEMRVPTKLKEKHRFTQESTYQKPVPRQGSFGLPYLFNGGSTEKKLVALTFDGGSQANAASAILDTLASRQVRATMFLTGQFIRKHPAITQAIVAAKHECGNHTYGHPHLTTYAADHTQSTLTTMHVSLLHEHLIRAEELFSKPPAVPLPPSGGPRTAKLITR